MIFTVAVLLAVGALGYTILVRSKDVPQAAPPSPTQHLDERKAQIYENLRDLQFEYRLGKLSDEDYQKTKLDLQKELARVMAEIDAIKPMVAVAAQPKSAPLPRRAEPQVSDHCPHCSATFAQPMRFCGACGKAMA